MATVREQGLLAGFFVLALGTAALKPEWSIYAILLAAAAGVMQIFVSGDVDKVKNGMTEKAGAVKNAVAEKASGVANAANGAVPGAKSQAMLAEEEALGAAGLNSLGGVLKPLEFQEYPLTEKHVISHNTAIYRFKLPKDTDFLGLPIGQHISLAALMPGQEKETVRSYTPISSDEDKGHFDLIIKSYPTGNISRHVGELEIGQTMKVKGPKGGMVYTPNMCRHIGMIAGGSGITPMLQIARAIQRGRAANGGTDKTQVDLIFANVNEEDILLREDLEKLAQEDPGFRVHYVLNNPPEAWTGGTGFVTGDMIKDALPAPADDIKILICGPPPMVSAMKKAVTTLGYEKPRAVSKLQDQVFCF